MSQKIAHNAPLAGAPAITIPAVYGGSPDKPFTMRLAVCGERPMRFAVSGLPRGLSLRENLVQGVCSAGEYPVTVTAENALGRDEKVITLKIAEDGMLRTPLLGFTTWNAFDSRVTQKNVTDTADAMVALGLTELGYRYVNVDSGWQKEYGGEYDAIQPNEKFPDMKAMYDRIHALGLKGGIYSTPMLHAWGCPEEFAWIPGCTRGEADIRFTDVNTGIGVERLEANNVRQWTEWGVDYLKYDWTPTDPVNADLMKKELLRAPREIPLCTTVHSAYCYWRYWQKNCCSWRDNGDTKDTWASYLANFNTADRWKDVVCEGHFYDFDMLAIGAMDMNGGKCRTSENEELFEYTSTAFFLSPIQLSMRLDALTEFEFDLITNPEMIAINQDVLCRFPELVSEEAGKRKIYRRALAGGRTAYAVFNLTEETLTGEIALDAPAAVRNVWERNDLGVLSAIPYEVEGHAAEVFVGN